MSGVTPTSFGGLAIMACRPGTAAACTQEARERVRLRERERERERERVRESENERMRE